MSHSLILLHIKNVKKLEQYPIDYTQDMFKKYIGKLQYAQHLFIEKKGINAYYTYLRRMNAENSDYFGFCFAFTGEYIEDVERMFDICEELIDRTYKQNELLEGSMPLKLSRKNSFHTKSPELKRINGWFESLAEDIIVPFNGTSADNSEIEIKIGTKTTEEELFEIRNYNHINFTSNKLTAGIKDVVQVKRRTIKDSSQTFLYYAIAFTVLLLLFFCLKTCENSDGATETSTGTEYLTETPTETAVETSVNQEEELSKERKKLQEQQREAENARLAAQEERIAANLERQKAEEAKREAAAEKRKAEREREEAEKARREAEQNRLPEIYHIEIGNCFKGGKIQTNYGQTIYSSETMYLHPRIRYKSYANRSYKFDVKWIMPDGTTDKDKNSPVGYSCSNSYSLSYGEGSKNLNGWGGETKGYWKAGKYAIEIWCNGTLLKRKEFRIY